VEKQYPAFPLYTRSSGNRRHASHPFVGFKCDRCPGHSSTLHPNIAQIPSRPNKLSNKATWCSMDYSAADTADA